MEWIIALVVLAVIVLRTTEQGGDWSDVIIGEARYNNWRHNFDFNLMFVCLGLAVIGVIVFLVVKVSMEETPSQAVRQTSHGASRPKKVFIQDLDPKMKHP